MPSRRPRPVLPLDCTEDEILAGLAAGQLVRRSTWRRCFARYHAGYRPVPSRRFVVVFSALAEVVFWSGCTLAFAVAVWAVWSWCVGVSDLAALELRTFLNNPVFGGVPCMR